MRKFILFILMCFATISAISKDLFTESDRHTEYMEINNSDAKFLWVTDMEIDTISVYSLLPQKGYSLICFSEELCRPSYCEFNRLYNEGIIDLLKNYDVRLIVLAQNYPFLNLNRLDSIARNNIEKDFEIYYNVNRSDNHISLFPCIWLIASHGRIIFHSVGLKENYDDLKEKLINDIRRRCPRCKGTGQVKPNQFSIHHIDECVGICGKCHGSGRL